MKILTVYEKNSFYRYQDVYVSHEFEITDQNNLIVYKRDDITGESNLLAHFKNWDYFTIEEE